MKNVSRYAIPLAALLALHPAVSSSMALFAGAALSLTLGNTYVDRTKPLASRLLGWCVMGLGAGMDLGVIGHVGFQGVGYTVVSIGLTMMLGWALGRTLRAERDVTLLVTVGTAICGGSAIAAVAPTIRARAEDTSVALATVFLLNALALMIFPLAGHALGLTQSQFGLWSALAIHDTSSVVGAALQYGEEALRIATTVKLARALWIVPLTVAIAFARGTETRAGAEPTSKPKRPWFILGFLLAAAVVTWIPSLRPAGQIVGWIARRVLVLTLFLIGANLTRATLRAVGLKPLALGVLLWVVVATATLGGILAGWIHLG
jgi:uncharacterized integral membrane protein (TIGR00698 family)